MIARLGALLGLWPGVWTRDFDGQVRFRAAYRSRSSPFDEREHWWCYAIGGAFVDRRIILAPGGKVITSSYVHEWREWKHNRKHVVFSGQDGAVEEITALSNSSTATESSSQSSKESVEGN